MDESGAMLECHIDREHDVLVAVGDLGPLHRELDLHLLSIGVVLDAFTLESLRDGLAAMALYLVSRPRFESFGWTIHLEAPLRNIFVSGTASESSVVGRAFLEGVHSSAQNRFYAQIGRPFGELQTSSVDVRGTDVFDIVRQYCERSDQQLVRIFRGRDGRVALVSALPSTDPKWLSALDPEGATALTGRPTVKRIAEKRIVFRCGCDTARIAKLVAKLYEEDPEELFRGDSAVEVECPRCAAKHHLSRELFDASLGAG
jgi:molecular chaperone Hsp33